MSYNPNNPNGQASAANSAPVVLDTTDSGYLSTIATNTVADLYVTGASAQTAIVNNILTATSGTAATDLEGYHSGSVQVTSTGTAGTFIFEGSNDNINFQTIPVYNQLILTGTPISGAITASASQLIYSFPVHFRYIRLRIATTITGGSIQAFSKFTAQNWTPAVFQVAQNTAANLLTTATISSGTVTTVATVTNSNSGFPAQIADVASVAITTTTTSGPFTPTYGNSYQVVVDVTAVSGTTPTMDIVVQESRDAGTNYVVIYQFPRITAIGSYSSPLLPLTGNRVEYIQTISGTTPSFTRSISRMQSSAAMINFVRQIFDRTVTLTTLSSTTASLVAEQQSKNIMMTINIGAATTAPALQIQGSDDLGASWYNIGSPLTAVASSSVSTTVTNTTAQLFRAIVTTAGSAVTAGYVMLRSF
jgi:hypothetical protein